MENKAKTENTIKSNLCSTPSIEYWVKIPDEHGDKYFYPLKDAKICPACSQAIQ